MQGDVLVRLDTKNPSVNAKLEEIIQATEGLHVLGARDPSQADLVIVELGRDMDRALRSVQAKIRWSLPKLWQARKATRDENPLVQVGAQRMDGLGMGGLD